MGKKYKNREKWPKKNKEYRNEWPLIQTLYCTKEYIFDPILMYCLHPNFHRIWPKRLLKWNNREAFYIRGLVSSNLLKLNYLLCCRFMVPIIVHMKNIVINLTDVKYQIRQYKFYTSFFLLICIHQCINNLCVTSIT